MSRLWLVTAGALLVVVPLVASAQEPTPAEPSDDDEGLEETGGAAGTGGTAGDAGKAGEPRPHVEESDEPGPEPPLVAPAPDTMGGHIAISPSVGVAFPFANLESGRAQTDSMSKGWAFGLDAAYGVSRSVAVGLWGQHLRLGQADACSACKTQSTAFGAFLQYHLVQGMRFDPWIGAGLGYRTTKISAPAGDVTYSGLEFLRIQLGGDWYAFDKIGFGPYLELDAGRYSSRSPGSIGDGANHWTLLTGVRVTLDLPGK